MTQLEAGPGANQACPGPASLMKGIACVLGVCGLLSPGLIDG